MCAMKNACFDLNALKIMIILIFAYWGEIKILLKMPVAARLIARLVAGAASGIFMYLAESPEFC